MTRHVERDLGRSRFPAEQVTYQYQVRGTGNRKELGQSLDDPKHDGLNNGHVLSV